MISLANNFVALTTSRYTRWEGFRSRLKVAVAALENVYNPSFYTRVGLRYKNVIRRSHFDVSDVPWSELLSPSILSELGSELADAVKETTSTTLIDLNNSTGQVRIRRALKADSSTGEPTYSIDADFLHMRGLTVKPYQSNLTTSMRRQPDSSGGAVLPNYTMQWPLNQCREESADATVAFGLVGPSGQLTDSLVYHVDDTDALGLDWARIQRIFCHFVVNHVPDSGLEETLEALGAIYEFHSSPPEPPKQIATTTVQAKAGPTFPSPHFSIDADEI